MMSDSPNARKSGPRAKRKSLPRKAEASDPRQASIVAGRDGDWMPAEDLREAGLAALAEGKSFSIDLGNIGHLDASALQILLALDAEQRKRGVRLNLISSSPALRQWFELAGAGQQLFCDESKQP